MSVNHIGETVKTKDGLVATLIGWKCRDDIDIKLSDGYILRNKSYKNFKDGVDWVSPYSYLGLVRKMNCGQVAEIVRFSNRSDIDVKIGDNILKSVTFYRFNRGELNTLGIGKNKNVSRLGEIKRMNCGMDAEITEYNSREDISVRFADNTVLHNKKYVDFCNGSIHNPSLPKVRTKKSRKSYIGETNTMKCGLKAKVIRSNGSKDIDVLFDNGEVSYNKRIANFRVGSLIPPSMQLSSNKREGEEILATNGVLMKLSKYISCRECEVIFEDGVVVSGIDYRSFLKGYVTHPTLSIIFGKVRLGSTFGDFEVLKLSYILDNPRSYNYLCKCKKCGFKDILTPSEMLQHKC